MYQVGQTIRSFREHYKKHIYKFNHNITKSNYERNLIVYASNHIIDDFDSTVKALHTREKGMCERYKHGY